MNEAIVCGICSVIIHQEDADPITARVRLPSRQPVTGGAAAALLQVVNEAYEEKVMRAEQACVAHFVQRHPRRLWLWRRLHWNWLMRQRWPWGKPRVEEAFEFGKAAAR